MRRLEILCDCGRWVRLPRPGHVTECLCGTKYELPARQPHTWLWGCLAGLMVWAVVILVTLVVMRVVP